MMLLVLIAIIFCPLTCSINSSNNFSKISNTNFDNTQVSKTENFQSNISDIILINENGDIVNNDLVFKFKQSFIFMFGQKSCPPCVSDYLQLLNLLSCDFSNQIIVISDHYNIRDLRILKNKFNCLNFYSQNRSEFSLFINDYILSKEEPAMMFLSCDGVISNFIRGSANDSLNNPYFSNVIDILGLN